MNNEQLIKKIDERIQENRFVGRVYTSITVRDALGRNNDILAQARSVIKNSEKEYKRGLEDAWALARKIVIPADNGGYSVDQINYIFDDNDIANVFTNLQTYQDALSKVEEYDKKLKYGDVVEYIGKVSNDSYRGIFLSKDLDNDGVWILDTNLTCPQSINPELYTIKKIGKHVDLKKLFEGI